MGLLVGIWILTSKGHGLSIVRKKLSVLVVMTTLLLSGFAQAALASGWMLMGERNVSRQLDKDVILVNPNRVFNKIQFKVRGADVNFKRMIIRYRNGVKREVAIRAAVPRGGSSREIDLPGIGRAIESVTFWYETKGSGKLQAKVRLWGLAI